MYLFKRGCVSVVAMALAVPYPGWLYVNVYVTLDCIAWGGHRGFPYTAPVPVGESERGKGGKRERLVRYYHHNNYNKLAFLFFINLLLIKQSPGVGVVTTMVRHGCAPT